MSELHRDAIEAHLSNLPGAVSEKPFGPDALVFKIMGKMFALVAQGSAPGRLTCKAAPADCVALESLFSAIHPGYHMNKTHWITIDLGADVDDALVAQLADASYALVVSGLRKADRERVALIAAGAG